MPTRASPCFIIINNCTVSMCLQAARPTSAAWARSSMVAAACIPRRSIHVPPKGLDKTQPANPAFAYFSKRDAKFLLSAVSPEHYEHLSLPEVTFAGRSNVGKSSLISAVLRSKGLVKTSKRPGHTSALNFFSLTSQASPGAVTVVDMPGYGFRSRDEWGEFIMTYLSTRKELRRVFMLVEAKVGGLKSTDIDFLELVEEFKVPTQIVLTKIDKLREGRVDGTCDKVLQEATKIAPSAIRHKVLPCSSQSKTGIDTLQAAILQACGVLPE